MNRRFLLTTAAAALATAPLSAFAQEAAAPEATMEEQTGIPEMVLGNPDAAVEVIEYASFTCPHCAAFHADQFQQLKANYIDTGKIRFVYREIYFDRFGLWASMIARCGGNTDRFFGISDVIYDTQREWTAGGDPAQIAANLRQIGKVAGLEDETLDACMSDGAQAQALVDWFTENSTRDAVEGTPTFLINGEKFSNMSYAAFAEILDAKLAE
jgi:protein-disulfide isomerase